MFAGMLLGLITGAAWLIFDRRRKQKENSAGPKRPLRQEDSREARHFESRCDDLRDQLNAFEAAHHEIFGNRMVVGDELSKIKDMLERVQSLRLEARRDRKVLLKSGKRELLRFEELVLSVVDDATRQTAEDMIRRRRQSGAELREMASATQRISSRSPNLNATDDEEPGKDGSKATAQTVSAASDKIEKKKPILGSVPGTGETTKPKVVIKKVTVEKRVEVPVAQPGGNAFGSNLVTTVPSGPDGSAGAGGFGGSNLFGTVNGASSSGQEGGFLRGSSLFD